MNRPENGVKQTEETLLFCEERPASEPMPGLTSRCIFGVEKLFHRFVKCVLGFRHKAITMITTSLWTLGGSAKNIT